MDMKTFAEQCRRCDPTLDPQMAQELLGMAAQIADGIDRARSKKADKIPYDDVVAAYNSICKSLPHLYKVSDKRKRSIKICFTQGFTLDDIRKAFTIAEKSAFLTGNNDRNWRACFDFIIKPDNLLKIIEGVYGSEREKPKTSDHSYDLDLLMNHAANNSPKLKEG